MSKNASDADNQQGSLRLSADDPSETTRQTPFSKKSAKAYLLGALHDGTFSSNRRFRISQKGTKWLIILKSLLRGLGYNSWIYREGSERKIYVLETLADFLDFRFNPLNLLGDEEKTFYVKGFFDAEGGIPKSWKDRFYIQLTQKDRIKLTKLKTILNDLGIKTGTIHNPSRRIDPNYWRMYVLSNSQQKFVRKVGSLHPRKVKTLRKRMMI